MVVVWMTHFGLRTMHIHTEVTLYFNQHCLTAINRNEKSHDIYIFIYELRAVCAPV